MLKMSGRWFLLSSFFNMTKVFYIKTDTLYIGYHQYNVYPLFLGSITNFFCKMCAMCMVWLPEFFFPKIFWICVWKCRCAKFRTSAHPHACKVCATCMVWLPEFFFFAKKFLEMCVKVWMCEISHVRTPARVRNVWAGASRCKRVQAGASRCTYVWPNIHTHHVLSSYSRVD